MAFTTQIFIFMFLPICLIAYFFVYLFSKNFYFAKILTKIRALDFITILISSGFYAWACFDDLFKLFIFIGFIYLSGLVIQSKRDTVKCVLIEQNNQRVEKHVSLALKWTIFACVIVVFILFYFSYTSLFVRFWNYIFNDNVKEKSIIAPIGLSFIAFSSISYLVDVYRKNADAKSIIDCALYITFFPKIISGPIVLWKDFSAQIDNKKINFSNMSSGILRIMVGFAKKLIIADTFGSIIASASGYIDIPTAWGIGLLYMLQIYFDFSGYSDIALGLALTLGFSFKENFNFPYLSCSITEFWRRWHISLGTWFKEYVYIPLGGNRKGIKRTLLNVGIVFLLTGIWHGAYTTYVLWGIMNGIFNCIEKMLSSNKIYQKTPKFIKWCITFILIFFSWQIFRFTSIDELKHYLLLIFGVNTYNNIPYSWQYYFDTRAIVFIFIALLTSTLFGLPKVQTCYQKLTKTKTGYIINAIVILSLFIIALMFMVNSNYNPFIYFRY